MLKGIDIYSEDNIYDWNAVKNAGIELVYIKATDGVTYVNPKLDEQYNGAKAAGLLVGFYHFAERNLPVDEYNHFIGTTSQYQADLPPVLDYEVEEQPEYSFISTYMAQNKDLVLYGSHDVLDNTRVPISKQWIAEPNTSPGDLKGYAGIQYSWTGSINGISNETVDLDLFSENVIINKNIVQEVKKVKKLVVVGNAVDKRAAEYLADKLQCPVIDATLPFDYSVVEDGGVIGVGGTPTTNGVVGWSSYVKTVISGADRYDTCQKVLDFIKTV